MTRETTFKAGLLNPALQSRSIDITAIENALIDILIKGTDGDLLKLGLQKGSMRLVDSAEQKQILKGVDSMQQEVEVGGSAANALRALAALGGSASYSSVVGNDSSGERFAGRLKALRIKNRLQVEEGDTGSCVVVVTPDGERTLNTNLGVCTKYQSSFIPEDDIKNSKIFFTTGYAWDTENQKESIRKALQIAKKEQCLVALDLADPFVVTRSGPELRKILESDVDVAFANSAESQILSGVTGLAGAKELAKLVKVAVVKDGAQGSYIACNGEVIHVPAPKVTVVDTTGAGDFYAGGFLYGLSKDLPLELCGKIATLMGSEVVQHMGVRYNPQIIDRVKEMLST